LQGEFWRESTAAEEFWRERLRSFGGKGGPSAGGFWREDVQFWREDNLAGANQSHRTINEKAKPIQIFRSILDHAWSPSVSMHTNRFSMNSLDSIIFVLIVGTGGNNFGREISTNLDKIRIPSCFALFTVQGVQQSESEGMPELRHCAG
jgi:hypothetical protein